MLSTGYLYASRKVAAATVRYVAFLKQKGQIRLKKASRMNNSKWTNNTLVATRINVYDVYHKSITSWMIILLLINVFGALANGLLFVTTIRYPPLRKSSSCILLAHCILVDLFMTFTIEPGLILITYLGPSQLPVDLCRGWGAAMFGYV